jgi:RimJ/RimL family protein N-acetyltransferase
MQQQPAPWPLPFPNTREVFHFRAMAAQDFELLHAWRCHPQLAPWWQAAGTLAELSARYAPRLLPDSPVRGYIAERWGQPVGYVQCYVAAGSGDGWWEDIHDPGVRGIDYFLAPGQTRRQGTASAMLRAFVDQALEDPAVTALISDPHPDNAAAAATLASIGFVDSGHITTPDGPARLMRLPRGALLPWPAFGVHAVHLARGHHFSKLPQFSVRLQEGLGVEGDAHAGATVRHRSRVARDPSQPNLRQVHLLPAEWLQVLGVAPGALGENISTQGLDLQALPEGTVLALGPDARIRLTGLRNPCVQIERFRLGLLARVLDKGQGGALIRRAGVMAVVERSGEVQAGDAIALHWPAWPHRALQPV